MKKFETFYRLTKQEKDRLVEQCRKEIEEKKVRELEEVRKILEELLEKKWETKRKTALKEIQEMQETLGDLQRQVTQAQEKERRNSTAADGTAKKLTVAEARNSELSGELARTSGSLKNMQERLTNSEERVVQLSIKLTEEEKKGLELRGKLTAAQKEAEDLKKQLETVSSQYRTSEFANETLRRAKSESARRIEELEESLKEKTKEAENNVAEVQKYLKETKLLEKKLEREDQNHLTEKSAAWKKGVFCGVFLAAILCVLIFPTHYVNDSPVPAEEKTSVNGTYTGGSNLFDQYSGFGELSYGDKTVSRGFWMNGLQVFASEYVFPNNGVYCGGLGFDHCPFGAGCYTRLDGEKIMGFWTWAEEKEVKIGENDTEYLYTGLLRFGKPYGYGVFEGIGSEEYFAGEVYDDAFRNGNWRGPDGIPRKVNSQ